MNVRELKAALVGLPDDMEVVMSSDAEGNNYSPLCDADPGHIYIPESTWSGEVYHEDWSADDACMEEDDWNEMLKRPRTLVLWPVN